MAGMGQSRRFRDVRVTSAYAPRDRVEAACLLQLVVAVDGGFLDHLIQLFGAEVHVHGSLWISARRFCSGGDEHANLRAELMLPVYLRRLSTSKGAARRFC